MARRGGAGAAEPASGDATAGRPSSRIMGELEAAVMDCVWELGTASVRDVHRCLLVRKPIAYTTVMTVMSRLAAKGMLVSRPSGRAYLYEATTGRQEFYTGVIRDFMSSALAGADRAVLAQFVDTVTERDREQLELLAQIIEEKRRESPSPR